MAFTKRRPSNVTDPASASAHTVKRLLQCRHLDASMTVGLFSHLHYRGLQSPQDILHRVSGLNRGEVFAKSRAWEWYTQLM